MVDFVDLKELDSDAVVDGDRLDVEDAVIVTFIVFVKVEKGVCDRDGETDEVSVSSLVLDIVTYPLEGELNHDADGKALFDAHDAVELTEMEAVDVVFVESDARPDVEETGDRVFSTVCVTAAAVRVLTSSPVFEIIADGVKELDFEGDALDEGSFDSVPLTVTVTGEVEEMLAVICDDCVTATADAVRIVLTETAAEREAVVVREGEAEIEVDGVVVRDTCTLLETADVAEIVISPDDDTERREDADDEAETEIERETAGDFDADSTALELGVDV